MPTPLKSVVTGYDCIDPTNLFHDQSTSLHLVFLYSSGSKCLACVGVTGF